jgi:hypothetical protein
VTEPPPLIENEYEISDWMDYLAEIHRNFLDSFVHRRIEFKGLRVTSPRHPENMGRGDGFWHLVTEAREPGNRNEDERIPDLNRCRRIRWIAWAIERASTDDDGFPWWEEDRGGSKHVVIWLPEHEYAVVLARRSDYYVLKTAFWKIPPHRRKAFEKARAAYLAQKS